MYAKENGISFKWLAVNPMDKSGVIYYRARLSVKLGRQTIGLGTDKLLALNIAKAIDEAIERATDAGEPVDLSALREMAVTFQEQNKVKPSLRIVQPKQDDLATLWDNYCEFYVKTGQWTEVYIRTHIQNISKVLKSCPIQSVESIDEFVQWLFNDPKRSPQTSKDRLKLIVAAIDWNSRQKKIARNHGIEWRDMLASIKLDKYKKSRIVDDDNPENIDIFQVSEIYSILECLRDDTYSRFNGKHSQYYPYAYFCWLTGCRPSEAVALKWGNVNMRKRQIKFCQSEVIASGKRCKRNGTKTQAYRYFPINDELVRLLTYIGKKDDSEYVFLSDKMQPINHNAFCSSIWKTVLKAMGLRHRTPYQLRHSMISYHANNDYPIQKLAAICGNSEEIIREHYLHLAIERISLPNIVKLTNL